MIHHDKIIVKVRQFTTIVVFLSFAVSFLSFIIHSQNIIDFSDKVLLLLLIVMRYSSFVLCICSLYKLFINIYQFFQRPSLLSIMKSAGYLIFIAYGVFIIFYASFITVIAGGNE